MNYEMFISVFVALWLVGALLMYGLLVGIAAYDKKRGKSTFKSTLKWYDYSHMLTSWIGIGIFIISVLAKWAEWNNDKESE